ncbi:MAG: hypothetical protein JXL80_05170 [Planctomycetes bacterium]|nr:hypothetical protein [Planctomycetota bacterium]
MVLSGSRTYVGFGFGPIQGGLLLTEAFLSGNFRRLVAAEIRPELIRPVRQADGMFTVNVAAPEGVRSHKVGPIEIYDVSVPADQEKLVEALAEAEDIGTAVTSVNDFTLPQGRGLHQLLAEGLRRKAARRGPRAAVYAAENHNFAAQILKAHVEGVLSLDELAAVRPWATFLDTVVGKMCGVVTDADRIRDQGLATVTPWDSRAFLVEEFNHVLVSRPVFDGAPPGTTFQPGLHVIEQKDDLLPFSEAKLYGTNATHALAAYVGAMLQLHFIAELASVPGAVEFLRAAFVEESGAALRVKYAGLDPLFTEDGYRRYAEDLIQRMLNPHLKDTVKRLGRDCERKLRWDDRLVGTIRLALSQGVRPRRYVFGAAAALAVLDKATIGDPARVERTLRTIWGDAAANVSRGDCAGERRAVLDLVCDATQRLKSWLDAGRPRLDNLP